jgi:hypothetical protein
MTKINEELTNILEKEKENKDVLVVITIHEEAKTSINIYARPALEDIDSDKLIPFTRAMIHLSKGEFDLATNMLQVINVFSNEGTLSSFYAEFIGTQMRIFED